MRRSFISATHQAAARQQGRHASGGLEMAAHLRIICGLIEIVKL